MPTTPEQRSAELASLSQDLLAAWRMRGLTPEEEQRIVDQLHRDIVSIVRRAMLPDYAGVS